MGKKALSKDKKAFVEKLNVIIANLMRITGIKNMRQLGFWLLKSQDTSAGTYFIQARFCGYLNYGMLVDRCIEEGLDLNEVFGAGKGKEYGTLLDSYKKLEQDVARMARQNEALVKENRKVSADYREASKASQEVMLKYLELTNKAK